jgi:hypothetical protein
MARKIHTKNRLVFGVGKNDADYVVHEEINGKRVMCPFYSVWSSMIRRCYSSVFHSKKPTYKNCFVAKEWLTFSTFKNWMRSQKWEGRELDKDILKIGNKLYSPDTCVFVTREVNILLVNSHVSSGDLPVKDTAHIAPELALMALEAT